MNKTKRDMTFGRYDYAVFTSFFSYASGSIIVPVALVFLAEDLGFAIDKGGMAAGGALHLGRTVSIVVSMLLCGFAAGRYGKRKTIGAAVAVMGVGIVLCAISPFYYVLLAALMIAGIGEGIIEGLATPFVQDLHTDQPGRYINFAHAFWSAGIMVTVLVSGVLLSAGVSWRILVLLTAAVTFIAVAILLFPESKDNKYPESPEPVHWKTTWAHAGKIFFTPRFWLFFAAMFVAGGGEFCLTFWCASFIQLDFVNAAWAGGIGTACFAGGMFSGRTGWGYLIKQHQLKSLIIRLAVAGTLLTLVFPFLTNLWLFFVLLFLAGIATAPFWPSVQSYCADCLPETDSTILFILLSCAGIPGCGFFTWLMGYIGNRSGGLRTAFYLVPACYLMLAAIIWIDGIINRKNLENKIDQEALPDGLLSKEIFPEVDPDVLDVVEGLAKERKVPEKEKL